jgi:polyisoprenoid-binding protein YceI
MMPRYRLDSVRSRLTVQAFATGLLSAFAHSPTFAARDLAGSIRFEGGQVERMALDLTVRVDSLELQDRVRDQDRREIEGRMRTEVLETAAYPEVTYQAVAIEVAPIAQGRYRVLLRGDLTLHGGTRPHRIEAELIVFEDGLRLRGAGPLRMPDYGITPVTALGGTIRLQPELRISFDIGALPEGP